MSGKYDDIIDLPHPEPQMPMRDRAAQFAPFAALTGHRAALAETERRAADAAEPENERFSEDSRALFPHLRSVMESKAHEKA